ncbi:MAG: hypothetical protein IMZ52_08680 [Actinobacteria bacterium]|nr:hypothetical protein [Actinomycetota bacterium]
MKPTQRRSKTPSKFLEDREYKIMWQLAEKYNYIEGNGVIGISKHKPEKIIRRPSATYWTGLNTYKFINSRGLSTEDFLSKVTNISLESLLSKTQPGDDENRDDLDAGYENIFRIEVPYKPKWSENLNLDLDKEEAEFFEDRIISISKNKLIAELLINERLWQLFINVDSFMDFAKAATQITLSKHNYLPLNLKDILVLAHDFSELMYGSHIAYNNQLHQKVFNKNYFEEDWLKWLQNIQTRMLDYQNFDPDKLFALSLNTRETTVKFVKKWWELTKNNFNDLNERDNQIVSQEARVKGSKARLKWNKFDDVQEGKWLGLKYFDYRFNPAKIILKDIKTGLQN